MWRVLPLEIHHNASSRAMTPGVCRGRVLSPRLPRPPIREIIRRDQAVVALRDPRTRVRMGDQVELAGTDAGEHAGTDVVGGKAGRDIGWGRGTRIGGAGCARPPH